MKLIKAMATVAGLTAISRVTGFARDVMTAAYLGAGPIADAFFVALKLPNFFRRVTAEGAFSVSFVPLYSAELTQHGEERATVFANRTFAIMLWFLSAFTLLGIIFMPYIINVIAPGFSDDPVRYEAAVTFSRITFPYLLLMSLTSLLGGVMNAHDRYAPFAIAPVLFNLALIGALLIPGVFENPGYALSWGVFAAGIFQFLLLFLTARSWIGFRLKLVRPTFTPEIKKLFKLMGPGVLGAGVVQVNLFADMIIASLLPAGAISYLYYADRLNQLPLSTVGIAVGTALLPMLSRAVSAKHDIEARHLFNRALEVTLFLGLPAALALFVLAQPIISVLFERGAFTAQDAKLTAQVLQGYVIGLPAYIAVKVFSTAFWSRQDTMTPVKIAIIVAVCNILLALVLIQFLGVAGIALSTGLVGWLYVVLLARPLKGQPTLAYDERFLRALPRIVLSTFLMGAALIGAQAVMGGFFDGSSIMKALGLGVLIGLGLGVYLVAVLMTGAVDLNEIKKYLKRRPRNRAEATGEENIG